MQENTSSKYTNIDFHCTCSVIVMYCNIWGNVLRVRRGDTGIGESSLSVVSEIYGLCWIWKGKQIFYWVHRSVGVL
jgi:hypothetical protein